MRLDPRRPARRSSAAPAERRAAPPAADPAIAASRARDRAPAAPSGSSTRAASAAARRRQRRACGSRRRGGVRRRDQPARNLDARGLRLALADQAVGTVALDLVELVAIDRDVAAGRQPAHAAPSGQSTAKIAAAVISAKTNQSIMAQGLHHGRRQALRRAGRSRAQSAASGSRPPCVVAVRGDARPPW